MFPRPGGPLLAAWRTGATLAITSPVATRNVRLQPVRFERMSEQSDTDM
jgi:hypothetical protein